MSESRPLERKLQEVVAYIAKTKQLRVIKRISIGNSIAIPDGGLILNEAGLPVLALEAKWQATSAAGISRIAKNIMLTRMINPDIIWVNLVCGPSATKCKSVLEFMHPDGYNNGKSAMATFIRPTAYDKIEIMSIILEVLKYNPNLCL